MWLRSSAKSLDGYGYKLQKVSRCRPAVSKVAPGQSINDIVLLDFLLILALPTRNSSIWSPGFELVTCWFKLALLNFNSCWFWAFNS